LLATSGSSLCAFLDGTVRRDRRNERRFEAAAPRRYNGPVRRGTFATTLALVVAAALGASSCGGGGDQTPPSTSVASTTSSTGSDGGSHRAPPPKSNDQGGDRKPAPRKGSNRAEVRQIVRQTKAARLDAAERRVAAVVRAYVAALDSRNGERVCSLFVPGALDAVRFPQDRADCASSVEASIGYRDPRGFPVYEGSRVARIRSVAIEGTDARVVATDVTRFAGNREPSIEDDVVYARQRAGQWLIAKPSAALYRAIGVGNIPPTVLAPPK
jgi:hypothetical protein